MLVSIRERAQSWIMWVIIIFLILMFGLWGISYYLTGSSPSERAVATVNGQNIPNYRLQTAYHFLKQKAGLLAPSTSQQATLQQQALQQLIDKTLLVQQAQHLSMGISQQDVNSLIYQLPAFQTDGKFDPRLLQAYLQSMGMNEQEFQKNLLEDLMVAQLTRGLTVSQFILPNEAKHFAQLVSQQRDINYHVIPARDFHDRVQVSDAEIEQYYQAHQQDFMTIPRTRVAYIDLSLEAIKPTIKPTDAQLQEYYQNHTDQFRSPGKRQGDVLLITSLLGMSQEQLTTVAQKIAKDWQEDKPLNQIQSEQSGQHIIISQTPLSWTASRKDQDAVHQALFKLQQTGQISSPIETPKGIILVKLTGMQPGQLRPYAQTQQLVRTAYIHQQAQQKLSNMANQLANLTFEHNRGLGFAANALGVKVQTTGYITQAGAHSGLLSNKKVLDAVFSPTVLVQGNNSDMIQVSSEQVAVVRASDYQPAKVKPLAKVRAQIQAALMRQDSTRLAMHQASTLMQKLQQSSDMNLPGVWQTKQLTRKSSGIDKALLQATFEQGEPQHHRPVWFTVQLTDSNAAVVKLSAVSAKSVAASDKQIYGEALNQLYTLTMYNGYVAAAKGQATIKRAKSVQVN